jgi:hypothetical protein
MQIGTREFRAFVWVAVVVSLAANLVDTVGGVKATLPHGVETSARVSEGQLFVVGYAIYGVADLAVSIVSTIGLLLFRKWSRPLTLASIVLQGSFYLLNSYYLESGLKTALVMLANILTGAIAAMAYTSTVAQRFR